MEAPRTLGGGQGRESEDRVLPPWEAHFPAGERTHSSKHGYILSAMLQDVCVLCV